MLSIVLKSLVDTQRAGGFKWSLLAGGKQHDVVFRCEVPFFCGDNEGLNKLCGRYGSNTNIQTPCRVCKVPFDEMGSTFEDCHEKINKTLILNIKTQQEERELSHHKIKNATDDLSFGAYNGDGIHQCSPFDILHTRRVNGTQQRMCESALTAKRLDAKVKVKEIFENEQKNKKLRERDEERNRNKKGINAKPQKAIEKKKRKSGASCTTESGLNEKHVIELDVDNDEKDCNEEDFDNRPRLEVTRKLTPEEEAKTRVFSPSMCIQAERLARYWGKLLHHQSDRIFDRTFFPNGITNDTKISGNERPGVLLLFLLIFVSTFGDQYFESAGTESERRKKMGEGGRKMLMSKYRRADYIFCFEEELLMDHFLRRNDIKLSDLNETFSEYFPVGMERYEKTLNRRVGTGSNFLKFHLWVHITLFITRFGCCRSFDSETGEKAHKKYCKEPAKLTQRRHELLDGQSSRRVYERILVDVAYCHEVPIHERMNKKRKSKTLHVYEVYEDGEEADDRSAQVAGINIDTSGKCAVLCSPNDTIHAHYFKRPKGSKLKTQVVWHDQELQKESLQFLGEKLIPMIRVEGKSPPTIHLYNSHKIGNMCFTANPQHYTQKGCTEAWHDWALADLSGEAFPDDVQLGRTAIHMMTFVEITGQIKSVDSDCVQCKRTGMYVLCHVLYKGGLSERAHTQSRLVNAGRKYCSRYINKGRLGQMRHPQLFLLPVDVIRGVCCAIPDFMEINLLTQAEKRADNLTKVRKGEKEKALRNPHQRYLFVSGKNLWKNIFETWAKNPV
jgi:hypothetical protein